MRPDTRSLGQRIDRSFKLGVLVVTLVAIPASCVQAIIQNWGRPQAEPVSTAQPAARPTVLGTEAQFDQWAQANHVALECIRTSCTIPNAEAEGPPEGLTEVSLQADDDSLTAIDTFLSNYAPEGTETYTDLLDESMVSGNSANQCKDLGTRTVCVSVDLDPTYGSTICPWPCQSPH